MTSMIDSIQVALLILSPVGLLPNAKSPNLIRDLETTHPTQFIRIKDPSYPSHVTVRFGTVLISPYAQSTSPHPHRGFRNLREQLERPVRVFPDSVGSRFTYRPHTRPDPLRGSL